VTPRTPRPLGRWASTAAGRRLPAFVLGPFAQNTIRQRESRTGVGGPLGACGVSVDGLPARLLEAPTFKGRRTPPRTPAPLSATPFYFRAIRKSRGLDSPTRNLPKIILPTATLHRQPSVSTVLALLAMSRHCLARFTAGSVLRILHVAGWAGGRGGAWKEARASTTSGGRTAPWLTGPGTSDPLRDATR